MNVELASFGGRPFPNPLNYTMLNGLNPVVLVADHSLTH